MHLNGQAIDIAADANRVARTLLGFLSAKGGYDLAGTAPHYHYSADDATILKAVGVVLLGISLIRVIL